MQKSAVGWCAVVAVLWLVFAPTAFADDQPADYQMINREVARYRAEIGSCPCPYSAARDGTTCGARSAWAKRMGERLRCFTDSVEVSIAVSTRHWPAAPSCVGVDVTPPRMDETPTAALPSSP